ncbi:NCS2 family permease [Amygdalobacter indicium]|uniref:NCS2 family permease n=1 Tax=Amygdalobacter indicium TaxID=3029272 RepID=A0ABY8C6H0_9FIRM|nr:NCS2 family permease [Amygdalobacter indicium]WEG34957.1 NCS2 family permease [Amygdalobacter indicium]WEG36232.1 NCS2 family permease [Amygdalobacter indicium]
MDKFFQLKARNTSVRTELVAGLTTFMTMSYILIVNPNMLSATGMDKGGVFTATIIASVVATLMMALMANLPFALAPGMGLNAFFTYSICLGMGKDWRFALTAVFLEGIIFLLLSLFKVREFIFEAIPITLKKAVSCGIGLFIALIGLNSAGIVGTGKGTVLGLGNLLTPQSAVFFFGLLVAALLTAKNIKGALFAGIVSSTVLALILGVVQLPTSIFSLPPSMAPVALQLQWEHVFTWEMFSVMFTFLFVDIFDTVGTLAGVATKAGLIDEKGRLPKVGNALFADAAGTTVGALCGTSTITTFVESAAGVADGGRTGLTSVSTAFWFVVSLFFFPLISIVPPQATASALVIVGLFMLTPIKEINFSDFTESIPAYITMLMMPFSYSIAEGISFGMISYVVLKVLSGKGKEVSLLMYILSLLFAVRIFWPLLQPLLG